MGRSGTSRCATAPFHHVSDSSSEDADGGLVYEVAPSKAFGFGRRDEYSQTRWRFDDSKQAV